jgi:predicted PurR-regulated permease PerM
MARSVSLTTLVVTTAIAAILHLGQEIFLPLACAMLVTFALAPVVSVLRRRGMPRLIAVLAVVTMAFAVIGLFLLLIVGQVGQLAQQLPTFQANIVTKLETLQENGDGTGLTARLTRMATAINAEIGSTLASPDEMADPGTEPMQVEVVERRNAVEMLVDLVAPLIRPVGTAGLVIVVVVFMLLEREELRDRFIRLVGSNDIHRTTQVLEEAGGRVAHYLLAQLLVNTIYAVPIGIGLWLIGVPNAVLWGMLTLVLRFVPYIGSVLAAAFPLFLAFAVSPDWSAVLWTAALFLVVELITSNMIEPWLYGSRTGVSPLAIIVAAIFWTWVWGPMGLILSTPLTVCLVVLGRHIPQFAMFDILFGDRPVLAAHSRLYQRLLVGDVTESTFRAEAELEGTWVADYHRDTGLPALLLAQADHARGAIKAEQAARLAATAHHFLNALDPMIDEELEEAADPGSVAAGADRRVLSIGGRTALDDIAARMFAQAVRAEGADVTALPHDDLLPGRFAAVIGENRQGGTGCVVLNFLDPAPPRGAILQLRRIKRAAPELRVGVVLWETPAGLGSTLAMPTPTSETREAILATGADFCVTGMDDLLAEVMRDAAPKPLAEAPRRARQRRAVA